MNKQDFLSILRQSLEGEVTQAIIEQNMSFYDQYIGNHPEADEKEILISLGDPRLIAKTIIEAERAASGTNAYTEGQSYGNNRRNHNSSREDRVSRERNNHSIYSNFKWYHYLVIAVVMMAVIFTVFWIGGILISFLFSFGLPIILVIFLYYLFRKK